MNQHKLEILLLLALMFIAFGLYAIPSQTYPNINEFDPFYHARVARELVKTGFIPDWEYMAYWPEGMPMYPNYPHLWHYTLAVAYWLVALVTTGSFAYNTQLFVKTVSWVMPFVGAFGVASMYLLGKEIRSKKAGLAAAVLFMFESNFMYKTMFAEIEEDAFGISLVVFALFAYVYALKRGGWKNGLFAGLALTALLLTWRGVVYAAFLVCAMVLWQGLKAVINKEWKALEQTTETFGISIIPVAVIGFLLNSVPQDNIYVIGAMSGSALILVLANYWFNYHKHKSEAKAFGVEKKKIYMGIAALLLLGAFAAGVLEGEFIMKKTLSGLDPGSQRARLYYTVAEHKTVNFEQAIASLGLVGIFGIAALAYFPLRAAMKWKKVHSYDVLVAVFLITSLIMFMGKNKMHYFFAPAAMLAIGIVMGDLISLCKRFGKWPKRLAILLVLGLLFAQTTIGVAQMEQLKTSYPVQDGWFKAMDWLTTTPEDTAFLTWWDYGHWTAFLGERHAIVDNTNRNTTKVTNVAGVFTEFRANSTEELEEKVLPQLEEFQVTHIGVDRILLYQKWGALTYIANRQCIPTRTLDAYGLKFPQLAEVSKATCGYGYTYSGEIGITKCKKKTVKSDFGDEEYYSCSFIQGTEIQFTEGEWDEIKATPWPGYPLTISAPNGGGAMTLRVYGQPDDRIMFFKARNQLLYDAPINYMYGFRIFFKDPGFKHHELVENEWVPNEEVVAYKVNYP
ncbi:MAG: hypothetical protein KAW41_03070 [Candidatus Diapherotrites archaeon]|nr:hypothetical protein [Candidatus Diapherotrites archaeon]